MPIIPFLSYIFMSAYTPGPNNIMAMSLASTAGFRTGMRFCFGVFFGFLGVMSLCTAFSALLFTVIPKIEPVMRYIGAAYILWLAWKIFTSKPSAGNGQQTKRGYFLSGIILQFINVKVILYGITAVSAFILPYYNSPGWLVFFVLLLSFVGFSGTFCWVVFGSVFQKLFINHRKLMNAVMALLLVYCALSILLSDITVEG